MKTIVNALADVLGWSILFQLARRLEAVLRPMYRPASDALVFSMAQAEFDNGRYQAARELFLRVSGGRLKPEADRMADWTAHKLGDISSGWPRYPTVRFNPPQTPSHRNSIGPIVVDDPNQPIELVSELCLDRWSNNVTDERATLVWFNFRSSLGGELFTARALSVWAEQAGRQLVVAADSRLCDILAANISGATVLPKSTDWSAYIGQLSGYYLARDAVADVLASPDGLARIAATTFKLPRSSVVARSSDRSKLAISWKTTNRRQGRYRNVPIRQLADALAQVDCNFVSAQHGVTQTEKRILTERLGERIDFDEIDPSADVSDLAAALTQMDGIVTIDNSVLHIGGTFGLRTLALLSVPSYWAWPASGTDSRWYPSVTTVHQDRPRDWTSVIEVAKSRMSDWCLRREADH